MISFVCDKGIDMIDSCKESCPYKKDNFCNMPIEELLKYIEKELFKNLSSYSFISMADREVIIKNLLNITNKESYLKNKRKESD